MTLPGVLGIVLFLVVVTLTVKPVGLYLYHVFDGGKTWLDPLLKPVERAIYRLGGVDPAKEMRWTEYLFALLAFNLAGFVLLYPVLRLQGVLPLNPQHLPAVGAHVAWNTAVSFVTNTNWQAYGGESTLSYLSQMWLTVQQFLSPISGLAMVLAFIRGLTRKNVSTLGNFWVDLTRAFLWVALPVAVVAAVVLIALGTPQNFAPYVVAHTLQGTKQVLPGGPVASMTSIMQFGDNGGGYFNTNAGYPFETPSAASLMFQLVLGFLVPVGLTYYFGKKTGDTRQGWTIFAAMMVMFAFGIFATYWAEAAGNPIVSHLLQHSVPNMTGKETRFGVAGSSLFEVSTTAVSWGSTAAANDSFTPIGSLILLFNMMTGEVIIGAWGVGLLGMLAFAILAVFLAGLMVGRTPEYLGKKIQAYEVKMATLAMIVPTFVILGFAAWAVTSKGGLSGIFNPGPQGLSEVLYAFSSGVGNNGSAMGGLNAASPFYTWTVGFAMLIGRFPMYIPALAIAGSLAKKQTVPPSIGTFPTNGWLFGVLLIGTVVIVGALVFFPALALGPMAEQFAMQAGHLFGGVPK